MPRVFLCSDGHWLCRGFRPVVAEFINLRTCRVRRVWGSSSTCVPRFQLFLSTARFLSIETRQWLRRVRKYSLRVDHLPVNSASPGVRTGCTLSTSLISYSRQRLNLGYSIGAAGCPGPLSVSSWVYCGVGGVSRLQRAPKPSPC